jgi:signal peptide peptidase SppA
MFKLRNVLWAGSDSALEYARSVEATIAATPGLQAGMFNCGDDQEKDLPYLVAGNVAVIPVKGPLVNVDSPMLAWFGMTGYPVLRRAAVAAAADPNIEHILLDINSPGGAVSGVADTGDLLARINAKVKPITTYTGGDMGSAACWLGVSAGQVFISRTSVVGSIGVIQTHTEYTAQLALEGVKKTVMRAGEFKALASPFEVLSDTARKLIQEQLDAAYKVFVQHVAECRGVSYAVADSTFAQGREFFGTAAKTAGLVDGISSLDAVVSGLQSKKVDKLSRRI